MSVSIDAIGVCSTLGTGLEATLKHLSVGLPTHMVGQQLLSGRSAMIANYKDPLPDLPASFSHYDNRNNRLAYLAYQQIDNVVQAAVQQYGRHKVGVIIGSSTAGIISSEKAMRHQRRTGSLPESFIYSHQEMGNVSDAIAEFAGVSGISYSVSTACSSASRAMISAALLLQAKLVDVVICGGVDTLCDLTINGFDSLEQLSDQVCQPFHRQRKGINIGEAAGLFVMSRNKQNSIRLKGWGESADAHHVSAPLPCGSGAYQAMATALSQTDLDAADIGYINAHGTGTQLNDAMEAKAIKNLFGHDVAVSSTKPMTGHCLGAAGALEAAICIGLLQHKVSLPAQHYPVHELDPDCEINVIFETSTLRKPLIMSNSFAFGGNNTALIFENTSA